MSNGLIEAFEAVEYHVPSLKSSFWCNQEVDFLEYYMNERGYQSCVFITAYNPIGIMNSIAFNTQKTYELLDDSKGFSSLICQTYTDGILEETGFLFFDVSRQKALMLQEKYRQVGIIFYSKGKTPQLHINASFLHQNELHPKRR